MSTDFEPDDDERSLLALFDETAPDPEPALLQRMARKAAQIPETAKAPWYRRLWSRQPWAVGAFATLAAVLALVGLGGLDALTEQPVALTPDDAALASVTSTVPAPAPSAVTDDDLDELLAFEVTDSIESEDVGVTDDPFDWSDDDLLLASDNPIDALDLLFVGSLGDSELLGSAYDDVLTEGG